MSTNTFNYHPDVFGLLVDTIPLLVKSKHDLVLFFASAGVEQRVLAPIADQLLYDRNAIGKFEIARRVLAAVNAAGDSELRTQREIVRRVVQFDNFDNCYENVRFEARGKVARVKDLVAMKDAATRILEAEARQREERAAEGRQKAAIAIERARVVIELRNRFDKLSVERDPQARGLAFEALLNDLFQHAGILVRDSFVIRSADGYPQEQIDGVIEVGGETYLVEAKWHSEDLGVAVVSQHMTRVSQRAQVRGLLIAHPGYTRAAIDFVERSLGHYIFVLATAEEILHLLRSNELDVAAWIREKALAAQVQRIPLVIKKIGV